ncbi:hypothetical protein C0995_015987 [Termitomyces sp. Mi166|nr:hypothetical protein C0995_015987 [Termitomyces sp. Mi166\
MKELGVGCIICCLDDGELDFLGAPWPEYENLANDNGIDVFRIPIPEGLAPLSPASLDADLIKVINTYTLNGIPVLVHCRGGVGRAGVIACCWLIRLGLCGWIEPRTSPPDDSHHGIRGPQISLSQDGTESSASHPKLKKETIQFVQRVIAVARRRRSLKTVETYEQDADCVPRLSVNMVVGHPHLKKTRLQKAWITRPFAAWESVEDAFVEDSFTGMDYGQVTAKTNTPCQSIICLQEPTTETLYPSCIKASEKDVEKYTVLHSLEMSFVKSKLKAARDALGKKDYEAARSAASQVLDYETDNYNATVFLALSLLELGEHEKSEQAYRRATTLNPENPLAWQGLSKYYEQREEWEKYADSLLHLIELYRILGDPVRCAESWQKLIDLRRERGTRLQVIETMSLLLPQSPVHVALSSLPAPDPTNPTSTTTFVAQTAIHHSLPHVEELVKLVETEEEETVKREVEKRRTRLGAPSLEVLKDEVVREVLGRSRLPSLYEEVLNHPNTSDDLRRSIDAKLLRHIQRRLYAIPDTSDLSQEKSKILAQVDELVKGAIILRIPDELAWTMYLESTDCETIGQFGSFMIHFCLLSRFAAEYDRELVKQFIEIFPSSPVSSLLKGYFLYMNIPLSDAEDDVEDVPVTKLEEEDPFDTILNAFATVPNSNIANRVLSELYVTELDYQNAIKAAESGLELLNRHEKSTSRKLPRVRIGYKVILATSLVHLFPPKHHTSALRIIDDVLAQSADNVHCLMGRAFVLEKARKWGEAATLFARVDELLPDNLSTGIRAREENAWCRCQIHHIWVILVKMQLGAYGELVNAIVILYWPADDRREEGYRYFILSLKSNPSYAPAFTSLGIYYAEYATPLDPNRASKCFQKAFELDSREAEAARRLAEGFAEDREWDLVEVVARRTIEGEGGVDAGMRGTNALASVRYLPTNAWAWKALGTVELHRRHYPPAIEAFQIALRAEPEDALSWLRLGECYSKAGRHVAAVKALERAQELDPHDWVCSYLIGDLKHQMGNYRDAIVIFESILVSRPTDAGVLVSLGQVYLDQGRSESSEGFQRRAEQSLSTCILVGLKTIEASAGFRGIVWKTIGDAIFALSARSTYTEENTVHNALKGVVALLPEDDHLLGFVVPPVLSEDTALTGLKVLEVALAAYSYRISLGKSESITTSDSAWFDLGIALHAWVIISSGSPTAQGKVISFLSQALREDPGNSLYWMGLGDAYFLSNAKSAQHAYIKAIEFDSKNVAAWTNLGLLYLYYNDTELANEALYRAQTLDPDYAVAWIGQALVATRNGHNVEAAAMFEHAIGLTPNVPEGDLEYSSGSFRRYRFLGHNTDWSADTLLPAFFVLDRYCGRRPDNATGLHLYALVCESLGQFETAANQLMRTIAMLEAAYEVSEDAIVERQFTIANSNLGRIRLALRDLEGATQSFESALGLLLPEDDKPETKVLRVQAHFGCGIANFLQGDLEAALANFEAALESASDDKTLRGQVTVLLAQAMWGTQNDEFKENSKVQLLECITSDPENLTAINTLAGMGALTGDESLVDAALSELLALPLDQRYERDPGRDVDYFLTQYHLGQPDAKKAVSVMQGALFAEPSRFESRASLATLMLQERKPDSALALLSGSKEGSIENQSTLLRLRAIALSRDNTEVAMREIQRAVMLAPFDVKCWQALALVKSCANGANGP